MPESRRLAIVDIARKYDVAILEDDALGRLHPNAPRSIASLAPDIAWYLMTMTKCITQGLRIAYLVTPSSPTAQRRLAPVEHLSCWHASPLSAAIVNLWVANGAAAEISNSIAQECIARERLAREILANLDVRSTHGSMHVWVSLPARLHRAGLVSAAERQGVLLRPSEVFAVDDQSTPNAVRLSLSPPSNLVEVRNGLSIVRNLIQAAL
jgi:DNA-binding transcriptional MocR family regulator